MNSTQEPRKVNEDEWYAAQARNDPSELRALVEQHVAYVTFINARNRCFMRARGSAEHAIVYMPDIKARAPGHVYSPLGLREMQKTNMCEWCFDKMAGEDDAAPEEKDSKGR